MKINRIINKMNITGWIIIMGLMFTSSNIVYAQNDNDETKEKRSARISISYTNINNTGPRLTAIVKSKVDKSYQNIEGVKVNFYLAEISDSSKIGDAITNHKGEAIFIPPETKHGDIQFIYYATIENDPDFDDKETEIEIEKSFVELKLSKEDSINMIELFVGAPDSTGTIIPREEVEAKIYVKRLFGLLPITEDVETTDDEGFININFPNDIPGDEEGILTIVAQIEDHETFGTLNAVKDIDWGIPLKAEDKVIKRELWSARANAPISMIIFINTMIIGIWGIIGYILFQLFEIRKIGKTEEN